MFQRSAAIAGIVALLLLSAGTAGAAFGPRAQNVGWRVLYPQRPLPLFHNGVGIGVDATGNVYVADLTESREKKLSPTGQLLKTWSLPNVDHGTYWEPSRLAVDSRGNSYLLLDGVLKYGRNGALKAHWHVGAGAQSIAVGGSGNVFVLSSPRTADGKGGGAQIEKYSPTGTLLDTWHTPVLNLKSVQADGVAVDPYGNVYVTVGTDKECYRVCLPLTSLLYRFSAAGSITRTLHVAGPSIGPVSAVDGGGTIYVLPHDLSLQRTHIARLSPAGKQLGTWSRIDTQALGSVLHLVTYGGRVYIADSQAGSGVVLTLSSAGQQLSQWGRFIRPGTVLLDLGLAVGPGGDIYVTGGTGHAVYTIVSPAGKLLFTSMLKYGPKGRVLDARSIRVDQNGSVFIVDGSTGRVVKFSRSGKLVARWPLPGAPAMGADDLALDAAGNIYITAPSVVFKLSPSGKLLAKIGGPGTGPGRFGGPGGITVDRKGYLYVADTYNNRVEKLSPDGKLVQEFLGTPAFDRPIRVALNPAGQVYVVDLTHNYIQKFAPDGTSLGIIGEAGALPGQFQEPVSLAFSARGDLYVLDTGNNRVQALPRGS